MDINRLAVFVSDLGYDEAESLTGIDADLLQKAIAGENLSAYEEALIDNGYSKAVLENDNYVDFDGLNAVADRLDLALRFIEDVDLQDSFRESVSFGQVDLDSLDSGFGLFTQLTENQIGMLVDWLSDDDTRNAKEFFDAYINDDFDIRDVEDSEFWEWFRSVFYE